MKGRCAAGIAVIAAGALACVSGITSPHARQAPAISAPAAPVVLGCGGGVVRSVTAGHDVTSVDEAIATQSYAVVSPTNAAHLVHGATTVVGDNGFAASGSAFSGALSSQQSVDMGTRVGAASIHTAARGDLRGIATNTCMRASTDQWFVGSSGAVGTSTDVILTNPGTNAVTVTIEAFGDTGKLELGGLGTAVVGAGQTKRIALDSGLASSERTAIHVTTKAGGISAQVQTSSLKGYTPRGISFLAAGVEGTSLEIAGVQISKGSGGVLRLVNPGEARASVSIASTTSEGTADVPGGTVALAPGTVLDLSLEGLDEGLTSFAITSDVPVAAGAMSATKAQADGTRDIAWSVATPAATNGAAVYGKIGAQLALTSATSTRVTVTPVDSEGKQLETSTIDVEAGKESLLTLPAGSVALTYTSEAPVRGGVVTLATMGIDWVPLLSADASEASTRIALG